MATFLSESRHGTQTGLRSVSNILVPLDGSELSRVAVPVVHYLVELYKATPHLIYAGEQALDPGKRMQQMGVGWSELPGAVIDQSSGTAPEIILGLTKKLERCLIVMCTHTGHKRDPGHFGSVTEAVLAGDPERIILIAPERKREPFRIRTLVLCHDGSPSAAVAAGPAAELARLSDADVVTAVVAAPCTECPEELGSLPVPQYIDQPQHEWPTWAQEFSMRLLAMGSTPASLKFELVVSGGQPDSELTQLARKRNADMVIMAVAGDWKRSRHNVPRVVARDSGCPVFFVGSDIGEQEYEAVKP